MKLKFGVLWIEDNHSAAEEKAIRDGGTTAGFDIEFEYSIDGADINDWASKQKKFHIFDLILLDLNLGNGAKGDKLARTVRELFGFTPILFYSASVNVAELRQRMAKEGIEGVFCAHRTAAPSFTVSASELILAYSNSLNRLSGMRGLAVEVVSQIDSCLQDIVIQLERKGYGQVGVDSLNMSVCEQAGKALKDFPEITSLAEKLKSLSVDSSKLFKAARGMLKKHISSLPRGADKDELSSLNLETGNYVDQILKVRNTLGHAKEEITEDGWQILDRNGAPYITVHDFPTHRRNFLLYLDNMRAIRDKLSAN